MHFGGHRICNPHRRLCRFLNDPDYACLHRLRQPLDLAEETVSAIRTDFHSFNSLAITLIILKRRQEAALGFNLYYLSQSLWKTRSTQTKSTVHYLSTSIPFNPHHRNLHRSNSESVR